MSLVLKASSSATAPSYFRVDNRFVKTLRNFSTAPPPHSDAVPSSYSNLPKLLKFKDTDSNSAMATTNDTEVSYITKDSITPEQDDQQTSTMEVSIDGHYDDGEEDNDVVTGSSSNDIGTNRPSVINLGLISADPKTTPPNDSPLPTPDTPTPIHHHSNGDRPERMREWLVRMINSGRFPGLEWLDRDKMVFRVPWVHAKKRDYNQERDAALFKEWAIHSGKYGDGSDVTTWKINFRCALNGLKDIIERKDLEGPDCRIYQMLPSTSPGRRRKRRRPIIHYSEMMQMQTTPTDVVPGRDIRPKLDTNTMFPSITPSDTPTTPLSTGPLQLVPIVTRPHSFQFPIPVATIQSNTAPGPMATSPHQPLPLSPATTLPKYYPVSYKPVSLTPFDVAAKPPLQRIDRAVDNHSSSLSSDVSRTPPTETILPEPISKNHISGPPVLSPILPSLSSSSHHDKGSIIMHPPIHTGNVAWPPSEFADNSDALTVRVMYGSITINLDTVDAGKGVRVFYGPLHCRDVLPRNEEEKLFGPIDSHQISLSPRHPSPLASEIFRTLKRGLVIDTKNDNIYATALCRAVVYCGSSPHKYSTTISKEERVKVFDYANEFLPALRQSIEIKGSVYPKPYVIFSFGQPWGNERSLSHNLITVVVTHCKALNSLRVRNVNILDDLLYEPVEHNNIRIITPTRRDLDAEEFLNPSSNPATPH